MNKILYPLVVFAFLSILPSCDQKPVEPREEQATSSPTKVAKQAPPAVKKQCKLTMGWDPWAPYQYLTPDDQVNGLDVDLISAMAREAGCDLKFAQNDWMNLLSGIRKGSIDLLGSASQTVARDKFALFSSPYRQESFVLYVRADQANQLVGKSLEQLLQEKFQLGLTEDYIYGDAVSAIQDNSELAKQLTYVPITEVNYYNLTQSKIDGFMEDPFVAAYNIKSKGLSEQITATNIKVNSGDVAIMFSKKSVSPETVIAFNQGLEKIKASGEYQKILDKYNL
jgi:polar amino acid transport system substrate-binding protein